MQNTVLIDDKNILKEKENRLSELNSEYEELINSLTEEEKESSYVNEAKDNFVVAEIKKALKSDSLEAEPKEKLHIANSIITEEKALKSEIKKLSIQLENKTKETIENLTDEQAVKLLKEKWIFPLVQNLMKMPDSIINVLTDKVEYLAKKI